VLDSVPGGVDEGPLIRAWALRQWAGEERRLAEVVGLRAWTGAWLTRKREVGRVTGQLRRKGPRGARIGVNWDGKYEKHRDSGDESEQFPHDLLPGLSDVSDCGSLTLTVSPEIVKHRTLD
jgi:hypothetical protein